MTRCDFEIIAEAMKECTNHAVYKRSNDARTQHALACNELAMALSQQNSKFLRLKFLRACGLPEATVKAL